MRTKRQTHQDRLAILLPGRRCSPFSAPSPAWGSVAEPEVRQSSQPTPPTVVLVHGAWADSSSWLGDVRRPVAGRRLPRRRAGQPAARTGRRLGVPGGVPPQHPRSDRARGSLVRRRRDHQRGDRQPKREGPRLRRRFHSAPGRERRATRPPGQPGSALAVADPSTVFSFVPYPGAQPGDVELTVLSSVFRTAFANDLSRSDAGDQTAAQRPVALFALSEPSGVTRVEAIPSWYVAGSLDGVLPIAEQRAMADQGRLPPRDAAGRPSLDGFPARGRRARHRRRRPCDGLGGRPLDLNLSGRGGRRHRRQQGHRPRDHPAFAAEGVIVAGGARTVSAELDGWWGAGQRPRSFVVDLAHADGRDTLVPSRHRGRLDILVNNVGAATPRPGRLPVRHRRPLDAIALRST